MSPDDPLPELKVLLVGPSSAGKSSCKCWELWPEVAMLTWPARLTTDKDWVLTREVSTITVL